MVTQTPRRGAVVIAVLFALSCFGLIVYVWQQFGGAIPLEPRGYRFHADFVQASQLTATADVRIAGVNVGKVVAVQRHGLRARATIDLERAYAPLPADARAILRQKTLLGETFVALTPGSRGAPRLPDGGTLPDAQVQDAQQLDTVLGSFDPPTQRNLRRMLVGISDALAGRGADLNAALGNAEPATESLAQVVAILDRQRGPLGHVIADGGRVLAQVGRRRAELQTLVTAGDEVLSATAARNAQLTATVRALPPFLDQLRLTLDAVDRTAARAEPSLAELVPVAPLLRPALAQLIVLAPALRGLMREAGPAITTSIASLPAVTRIVDASGPFSDRLLAAARQVTPAIDLTKLYGPTITSALANLGAALQATTPLADGTSAHYLRTLLINTNESTVGASQRFGSDRHNPYPAPGILSGVGNGGITASDCRNVGNASPPPAASPPCRVQPPLAFGGALSYYPRLTPLP